MIRAERQLMFTRCERQWTDAVRRAAVLDDERLHAVAVEQRRQGARAAEGQQLEFEAGHERFAAAVRDRPRPGRPEPAPAPRAVLFAWMKRRHRHGLDLRL